MFKLNKMSFTNLLRFSKNEIQEILIHFQDYESTDTKESVFVVGEKASGKTNFIANLYKQNKCDFKYLNINYLAEKNSISNYTAKNIVYRNLYDSLENNKSFLFETTLSTLQDMEFIKLSKEKGFHITLIYITTSDVQINISRLELCDNLNNLELQNLILNYEHTRENINSIKNLCDNFYIIDNSKNIIIN